MNDITLRHVCKSYTTQSTDIMIDHAQPPTRTRQVLRDVNVTFPLGKLTVLVGRCACFPGRISPIPGRLEFRRAGTVRYSVRIPMSSPGPASCAM